MNSVEETKLLHVREVKAIMDYIDLKAVWRWRIEALIFLLSNSSSRSLFLIPPKAERKGDNWIISPSKEEYRSV